MSYALFVFLYIVQFTEIVLKYTIRCVFDDVRVFRPLLRVRKIKRITFLIRISF